MKALVLTLVAVLLSFGSATRAASQDQTVSSDPQLEKLISKLESKTDRRELIEQLKLLQSANSSGASDSINVVQWLGIDRHSNQLTGYIAQHLQILNNIDTLSLQLGAVALAFALLLVWIFINRLLVNFSERHLKLLRRRFHLASNRFDILLRLQNLFGILFGIILFVFTADQVLKLSTDGKLLGWSFSEAISQCFTLLAILALFATIWEIINGALEFSLYRSNYSNNSRIQTLLPVVRNILLVTLSVLSALVILSELGIDIMPLLAGAGVLGIAIGFGAQTLVKDFLTGITVILEDLLQIGDVVQVGNRMGAVERITLRKIQLRDLEGIVHTVPFGEVSIVDNYTKEYSYYLFDVGVAYKEDTDTVIAILNEVDASMRDADEYKHLILEPLETLGVDEFADSAVVIKARVKTVAHERWTVGREYKRRIKYAFDQQGIEIPFPHQTVYFGDSQLQLVQKHNNETAEQNNRELIRDKKVS